MMWRYRVNWSGWQGGPGISTFYGNTGVGTAQGFADGVNLNFFKNLFMPVSTVMWLPSGVRVEGDQVVDEIDEANGQQQGSIAVSATSAIIGTTSTNYAAPAGASVTWNTSSFVSGTRVRGRTYLVPLGGSAFATDGTLSVTFMDAVVIAVAALIGGASENVVWHRPTSPTATDGSQHIITSGAVRDRASILTSRRA